MGRHQDEDWEESDEGVLDNWEEELEEKPVVAVAKPPHAKQPVEPKPTKAKKAEPEPFLSEADRKRRLELAVKRSDLQNTMDLFGVNGEQVDLDGVLKEEAGLLSLSDTRVTKSGLLESSDPQSIPEFERYADSIANHLNSVFGERKNFVSFLETLLRRLLSVRDITELRRMSGLVQDLVVAKQKEQQRAPVVSGSANASVGKAAPVVAAKKKPSLLMGAKKGRDLDTTNYDDDYDDDE